MAENGHNVVVVVTTESIFARARDTGVRMDIKRLIICKRYLRKHLLPIVTDKLDEALAECQKGDIDEDLIRDERTDI